MTQIRFINDVIKPWDELNLFLKQDYALQLDLSDVTRMAGQIAVSLRHQIDFSELKLKEVYQCCPEMEPIVDAGDYWKHGELRDPARNCEISSASAFEYSEGQGFRFIRNKAQLNHPTLGKSDFLEITLVAIHFWIRQHGFSIPWNGSVKESGLPFAPTARLQFDPRYCIQMDSMNLQMYRSTGNGHYEPCDPPLVRFELY